MAGFYVHIPFCRKLCYYCDFHFSVSLRNADAFLAVLEYEIISRKPEGEGIVFDTLYFGGGTPSILPPDTLQKFIALCFKHYAIREDAEITMETNPDDLTFEYVKDLKATSQINRLSIGIQSFHDRDLELMNRRHSGNEGRLSLERSLASGFDNITVDLIYGIPGTNVGEWMENLDILAGYSIPHFSAYHLTFEAKTVFSHFAKKGRLKPVEEDISVEQYQALLDFAEREGYENYEISNFAKPPYYSKHNLGYWTGEPYLGFGPSAHSFRGNIRRWNLANNTLYIKEVPLGKLSYFETEAIDPVTAYNEYLLTRLRTGKGVNTDDLRDRFGMERLSGFLDMSATFVKDGIMEYQDLQCYLTRRGKLIADWVIGELMILEE